MVIASIAALALGGPSPGHIGSCDGSAELTSFDEFCPLFETFSCERDYNLGMSYSDGSPQRITESAEYRACGSMASDCRGGSYGTCNGVSTRPTTTQTDACLAAMQDRTRFQLLKSELAECRFCPGGV